MEQEINETQEQEMTAAPAERAFNLPMMIVMIALVVWFGFHSYQLASERAQLGEAQGHQEAAMQEAKKLRAQFESVISKTSELANKGHAGAKLVMDELQNRGMAGKAEPSAANR